MTEELALDQVTRYRGTVDRHRRPARARAGLVDGARKDLLAAAGFAQQQDRGLRGRDLRCLGECRLECPAAADDLSPLLQDVECVTQLVGLPLHSIRICIVVRSAEKTP